MDTTEQDAPVRTLEDAAKAELKRKVETIRARQNLGADDALDQAMKWQQQETGQADGFELTPSSDVFYYRVWYRRYGAVSWHEQIIVRTDTRLYHWAAISEYLAHRIRETYDAQCRYVATFVEATDGGSHHD